MARNDSEFPGDIQSALGAGAALGDARAVPPEGGAAYAVVPYGYQLQSLEQFLSRPLRIRQAVDLHERDAFIQYVKAYAYEPSCVFFDTQKETFTAIFDYHESKEAPAWCSHTATYTCRRSIEFTTWMNQNKKNMDQVTFARFLEDNLPDIVSPPGARMLEVALTFEAKKEVEYASGVRLQSGQIQFTYNEIIRGTQKSGTLEVPDEFILGIPIHVGGDPYRIPVRFRWRLQEGKALFWYEIVRPYKFIEDALKEVREKIAADTLLPVLAGSASS